MYLQTNFPTLFSFFVCLVFCVCAVPGIIWRVGPAWVRVLSGFLLVYAYLFKLRCYARKPLKIGIVVCIFFINCALKVCELFERGFEPLANRGGVHKNALNTGNKLW